MTIEVDLNLEQYVADNSGAATFELRGASDSDAAAAAMRAGREGVFGVPHPEEPDDPLPSFASEVELGERGPRFWIDIADAEVYEGLITQVVAAVVGALEAAGVEGRLTWPDAP